MMAIKGVLFDKDGTLIDVNGTWVPFYKTMLKQEQGLSEAAIVAKMEPAGLDAATDSFRAGSTLAGGTTRQIVEMWWPDANAEEHKAITYRLDHDYRPLALSFMKPLMPLAPVLEALKAQDLVLGVATNDGEQSARGHMQALKVDKLFHTIMGADSVAVPKPSGLMVKRFAERTGLKASEIAMVGDNIHDLEEAQNGGAGLAIGVLTGNAERHHLQDHADHVFDSIADLPAFFRSL